MNTDYKELRKAIQRQIQWNQDEYIATRDIRDCDQFDQGRYRVDKLTMKMNTLDFQTSRLKKLLKDY